jgi:hypothetical protein
VVQTVLETEFVVEVNEILQTRIEDTINTSMDEIIKEHYLSEISSNFIHVISLEILGVDLLPVVIEEDLVEKANCTVEEFLQDESNVLPVMVLEEIIIPVMNADQEVHTTAQAVLTVLKTELVAEVIEESLEYELSLLQDLSLLFYEDMLVGECMEDELKVLSVETMAKWEDALNDVVSNTVNETIQTVIEDIVSAYFDGLVEEDYLSEVSLTLIQDISRELVEVDLLPIVIEEDFMKKAYYTLEAILEHDSEVLPLMVLKDIIVPVMEEEQEIYTAAQEMQDTFENDFVVELIRKEIEDELRLLYNLSSKIYDEVVMNDGLEKEVVTMVTETLASWNEAMQMVLENI